MVIKLKRDEIERVKKAKAAEMRSFREVIKEKRWRYSSIYFR